MTTLAPLLLLAVPLGLASSVRAADVQLRWRLAAGTQLWIQLRQTSQTETAIRDHVTAVAIDTGLDLHWHVDRVDEEGTAQLTQSFTRLWLRSVAPDGKVLAYDSNSTSPPAAESKSLADAVQTLLRLRVALTLSSRGEILDVQRPAETDSLLGDLPASAGWKSLLTRDGMQRALHQALGRLPEGPVAAGSSWSIVRQLDAPLGQLTATDTYTYEGAAEAGGRPLERIRVSTQWRLPAVTSVTPAPERVERQQVEGEYLFDTAAGLLAEARLTQTLVSEVPYGDGKIRVTTRSNLTARLSAAQPGQ